MSTTATERLVWLLFVFVYICAAGLKYCCISLLFEMLNEFHTKKHVSSHYAVGIHCNLLWSSIDCFLSVKQRESSALSPFPRKELMRSLLNNSELTEDMKISLSHKLGVTEGQVKHFFQTQSKKPRNVNIKAYSDLEGKGLKWITESADTVYERV